MIRVVATKLDARWSEVNFEHILSTINALKKNRLMRLRRVEDVQRGLAGELLLRYVLLQVMNISDYEIEYNENGKPYLKNHNEIFFNISHAGDYVVCAVADCEVGIDVEGISYDYSKYEGVDKYIFTEEEIAELSTMDYPERAEYFYDLWTQKEAFAKCLSIGMSLYDGFRFRLPAIKELLFEGKCYYFKEISIDDDYKSHLCSVSNQEPVLQLISIDSLSGSGRIADRD